MSRSPMARSAQRSALFLTLLAACNSGEQSNPGPSDPQPLPSELEFVSAEGRPGEASRGGPGGADAGTSAPSTAGGDSSSNARTVEEGDIYRAYTPGKLLNLNPYRGLQVIDIGNVQKPKVIGRLREAGAPVEMYVIGQRAVVLLNHWTGYWGSRRDVKLEQRTGGLVLSVDLTDPSAPKVLDRKFVPGNIVTSRLTRQGERSALYVAAAEYDCSRLGTTGGDCTSTIVKSLDTSGPELIERSRIDLGGYVSALQATPEALLVARTHYDFANGVPPRSSVSLVDITSVDGDMTQGAEVTVEGQIASKFNLDLHGGVLRVVSGARFRDQQVTNHVETFDATPGAGLRRIDHCTFGAGQQLFGTLFLQDRAFFVTYLRQDPFHAFALDSAGHCQERSEFLVSGWNDFFKPTFDGRRLIGIGKNDQLGQNVAVSLYDITNLDNPTPLLAREQVSAQGSWSQANFDDKAFSVVENAVSVPAKNAPDVVETGLVLLPYQSYGSREESRAGVQIYTFSDRTISSRGFMDHGQPVTRSFKPDPAVTANLSVESLSLFDARNPDAPIETGRVELAPNYSDVHDFGAFLVRIHDTRGVYGGWWSNLGEPPPAYAEIIAKTSDPDAAPMLSKVVIPAGARTHRVGSLLVATSTRSDYWNYPAPKHDSTITVYELADPANPRLVSSLKTDRLLPAYGYGWGGFQGYGCGMMYGSYYDDFSRVLPNALVLGRNLPQQESIGVHEICSRYLGEYKDCVYRGTDDCEWSEGQQICQRKLDEEVASCQGGFVHCKRVAGVTNCTPLEMAAESLREYCSTTELYRYWQSMELDVLDLRNPQAPTLTPVSFAKDEQALGLVAAGQKLYFTFKRPHVVANDPRAFAKYYFREIGLNNPSTPEVGEPVNVPGQLLAVDGARLFTRDLRWGNELSETWLHALERVSNGARILASQRFEGREVHSVLLDGTARVLVSHRGLWQRPLQYGQPRDADVLTIYDAGLEKIGETEVDSFSELTQAVDGRVLFKVPSGLMVVNAQNPAAPYAQAYFPYSGYVRQVSYDGQNILLAAGPYGLFQLDATTHNLLPR